MAASKPSLEPTSSLSPLERLPNELIFAIADYLPISSKAILTTISQILEKIIGTQHRVTLLRNDSVYDVYDRVDRHEYWERREMRWLISLDFQQHLYCFQCDDFHHWDQASKTLTANDREACQRGGRYKARSILGSEGMISKVTEAELHMALKSRHRGQSYHIPSERTEHHLEYHFVEPHSAPPQQQRPVDNSAQNLYANSVDLWTSWKACSRVTKYKLGTEYRFAYESFMLCRTESWTISWETLRAICYEYLTYLWAIEQWPPSGAGLALELKTYHDGNYHRPDFDTIYFRKPWASDMDARFERAPVLRHAAEEEEEEEADERVSALPHLDRQMGSHVAITATELYAR
ncbi:hypothetical protein B0O99DRAFT_687727 [Bisporella sp. PMI_857]|nr:hypothetical protein B0O99DRAFT_687727 [Bisporella sp. PMI_857]